MKMVGKGKSKRPVLKVQWTELQLIMIVFGIIGIAVMSGAVLLYWPELPAQIPTHFGFSGEADAWGDKTSLIYLALVAVGLFGMMLVFSRFPHTFNYPVTITEENAEVQYRMAVTLILGMGAGIVWLFAYICLQMIRTALGQVQGLGSSFLLVVLVVSLGGLMGYVILAARRAR